MVINSSTATHLGPISNSLGLLFSALCSAFQIPRKIDSIFSTAALRGLLCTPASESIDKQSIPSWHLLGSQRNGWPTQGVGTLQGRTGPAGARRRLIGQQPHLANLATMRVEKDFQCDIRDIVGFSASKSPLKQFSNTDDMIRSQRPDWLEVSQENLANLLSHAGIRILHQKATTEHFARYAWDGRLWLCNEDGSHHVAAAKYVARMLDERVPMTGKLVTHALNGDAVTALRRTYDILAMPESITFGAFYKLMEDLGATWLWVDLPNPFEQVHGIFLPKSEVRSRYVAGQLRRVGVPDLGALLGSLVERQASLSRNCR